MTDPEPVSEVTHRMREAYPGRKMTTVIWWILGTQGCLIIALAVICSLLAVQRLNERSRVDQDVTQIVSSQCGFYYPLAIAPLNPKMTSKFGVQIVEGSRRAVHGLGCPEKLPPPSRTLLELGLKYGIQITY